MLRLLLCAVLLLATGCASDRIAGWYITRQLDGYFDFDGEQKARVRADVDALIAQVRKEELTHWITFLREVRAGLHDGLTDEVLARLQRRYDARIDVAVHLLTPHVAPILVTLRDAQLDKFEQEVREDLAEQYEDLKLSPDERQRKLEKKALEVVEDFVGELDDAQQEQVRALIRQLPNERDAQYRSAQDNLAHFRSFMATHPSAPALESELYAMWEHRYDALGVGHDKEARRALQRKWLLSVYQVLNAEQRAHAEEELSSRIRMLKRWTIPPQ
jgi:hypothetical protein